MDGRLEEPDDDRKAAGERKPIAQSDERIELMMPCRCRHTAQLPVNGQVRLDLDDLGSVERNGLAREDDELVLAASRQRLYGVPLAPRVPLAIRGDHQSVEPDPGHDLNRRSVIVKET